MAKDIASAAEQLAELEVTECKVIISKFKNAVRQANLPKLTDVFGKDLE